MNRKMYWGIAALMIILIAAGGFIYWQWSQVQQLREELAQDEKMLEEQHKGVAENDLPPAKPGYKWVLHGDHWHEMPIAQSEVPQEPFVDRFEQERLQKQVEAKSEADKQIEALAAAKTAREKNQVYMEIYANIPQAVDMYNFYKEHPDFDPATASPELVEKWEQASRATHAKMSAWADEVDAWNKKHGTPMDRAPKPPEDVSSTIVRPNKKGGNQ